MSLTACSGSAVESTTIALMPPVSAISAASGEIFSAIALFIVCAVDVDPVKQIPPIRESSLIAAPTTEPRPGKSCRTGLGTPALCKSLTAIVATIGVGSAGFANTPFPAASAAATCPVKMARGKFQGEMHAITPRAVRFSNDLIRVA